MYTQRLEKDRWAIDPRLKEHLKVLHEDHDLETGFLPSKEQFRRWSKLIGKCSDLSGKTSKADILWGTFAPAERSLFSTIDKYQSYVLRHRLCLLRVFSRLYEKDNFISLVQDDEDLADDISHLLWGLEAIYGLFETDKINVGRKATN